MSDEPTPKGATLHLGDCLEVMAAMDENSIDAIVCDPPYGLEFMGKEWDHGVPGVPFWAQALRVLKPGGHLLAAGGTRTFHRLACAIEDAGFEIRDCISWLYACLSDDTEILVDGEWVHYSRATPGRLALCYDVERDEFSWKPIGDLFVYDYADTAYRIVSDRTDQIVSRNHRCLVEQGGAVHVRTAETLDQTARVPILESLPQLLRDLPCNDEGAGSQKQELLEGLCDRTLSRTKAPRQNSQAEHDLLRVREGVSSSAVAYCTSEDDKVFQEMQRDRACQGTQEARPQGPSCMDGEKPRVVQEEDDGKPQPGMEGGRHVLPETWKLQADQVRSLSGGLPKHGPEGWVCDGAQAHSCNSDEAVPTKNRSRASRQPRSARQQHREPSSLQDEQGSQTVRGSRYTTSDLARVEPFAYVGKVWCVNVPTGTFVVRRNGKVFVTGNSGFPKSLDVGKAIDRQRYDREQILIVTAWIREARDAAGISNTDIDAAFNFRGMAGHWTSSASQPAVPTLDQVPKLLEILGSPDVPSEVEELILTLNGLPYQPGEAWFRREVVGERDVPIGHAFAGPTYGGDSSSQTVDETSPATDAARDWDGWGTSLKPSFEPFTLARKPLIGTVAANVLAHGTGALNIEASRVGSDKVQTRHTRGSDKPGWEGNTSTGKTTTNTGRWPANLILDEEAGAMLDEMSGESKSSDQTRKNGAFKSVAKGAETAHSTGGHADSGGASRFFFCPKVSTAERHGSNGAGGAATHCDHPTLKPVDLMAYLCRLITPPGGIVLDPFMGSGSTGIAALRCGFTFIGIEKESEYLEIAKARIREDAPLFNVVNVCDATPTTTEETKP